MKKLIALVAFICIAAPNANAQTEEPESKAQKFFRLTKTADENPKDWKAQLEAGHFLLDKDSGMYNQSQAVKYYERLYHLATDCNKEIPDSVIHEAGLTLMTVASDKKNLDKALFYADEMLRTEKVGLDLTDKFFYSFATVGFMYNMMKDNREKSLTYMLDIRDRLTKNKQSGIEYTDVMTAIIYEHIIEKYKEMFGDKLVELTLDGKKYILIAKGDWNIEKSLMGWMAKKGDDDDTATVFYCEDGKTYDDIHGDMVYSFLFDKDGIRPQDGTNMRMTTVTPERRQQLVEAYHKYIKKNKKNKK